MGDVMGMVEHVSEKVIRESAAAFATTPAREPGPLLLQFMTVNESAFAEVVENIKATTRPELAISVESPTRKNRVVRNRW